MKYFSFSLWYFAINLSNASIEDRTAVFAAFIAELVADAAIARSARLSRAVVSGESKMFFR